MNATDQAAVGSGDAIYYARIWPRVKAMLIDSAILAGAFLAAALIGANLAGSGGVAFVVCMAFLVLYDPVMVSLTGATIGHRLQNLRVVSDRTGGNPSLPSAFVRYVVKAIFGILSLLAMAGSARQKALHDSIGRTTVQARDPGLARLREFTKVPRHLAGLR